MGLHFLLQGIFLTQRLNLYLLHWQADSLPLILYLGSPECYTFVSKYKYSFVIQRVFIQYSLNARNWLVIRGEGMNENDASAHHSDLPIRKEGRCALSIKQKLNVKQAHVGGFQPRVCLKMAIFSVSSTFHWRRKKNSFLLLFSRQW